MAALTIPDRLGQIRSRAGYVYQLVPEDLLWLARAVQFEGGSDYAATIWTYAQLAVRRNTSSLTSLIRAHSQPVNPLWQDASTEKCQRFPQYCTQRHLERRKRARTITWSEIYPAVRAKVVDFAQAKLDNPVPRAVDFANPTVSQGFIQRNPGTEIVKKAGNWYLATPDVQDWPTDYVSVTFEGRTSGTSRSVPWWTWGAVAVAVVTAGAAIYYLGDTRYKQWS